MKTVVTTNTSICCTFRTSELGMMKTQRPTIMNRLKAAEPTIVCGPSSPMTMSFLKSSMTERRISGAEEPSAMSVRFATVSFHTRVVMILPFGKRTCCLRLVIASMAPMKMSATMETPRKK